MRYLDEYRDKETVLKLSEKIKKTSKKNITLMEICGGHTAAIHKFGIPELLPANIKLISGPGCPVCVTSGSFIDKAVFYAGCKDVIIATFGDMIKVPGSNGTLDKAKAKGSDIRVVYSSLDALEIARKNKDRMVVFLGIGFETTAPTTAAALIYAKKEKIKNFFVLSAHKIMPPAMLALLSGEVRIDGYICPGHVSVIAGTAIYREIAERFKVGCVVSGFEPVDLLQTILMLVIQMENNKPEIEIQYKRVVKPEGNVRAQEKMNKVFILKDTVWRGLGIIPGSGLSLNDEFAEHDIEKVKVSGIEESVDLPDCICADILKGLKTPFECGLFGKRCTPAEPVGACMVSGEGACNNFYRYKKHG